MQNISLTNRVQTVGSGRATLPERAPGNRDEDESPHDISLT
jgi:hypothetical protein